MALFVFATFDKLISIHPKPEVTNRKKMRILQSLISIAQLVLFSPISLNWANKDQTAAIFTLYTLINTRNYVHVIIPLLILCTQSVLFIHTRMVRPPILSEAKHWRLAVSRYKRNTAPGNGHTRRINRRGFLGYEPNINLNAQNWEYGNRVSTSAYQDTTHTNEIIRRKRNIIGKYPYANYQNSSSTQ